MFCCRSCKRTERRFISNLLTYSRYIIMYKHNTHEWNMVIKMISEHNVVPHLSIKRWSRMIIIHQATVNRVYSAYRVYKDWMDSSNKSYKTLMSPACMISSTDTLYRPTCWLLILYISFLSTTSLSKNIDIRPDEIEHMNIHREIIYKMM